jgi:hypothetical protein
MYRASNRRPAPLFSSFIRRAAAAIALGTLSSAHGATVVTVDAGPGVGQGTSLAIGADGMPRISYRNAGDGSLRVATCTAPDCSSATLEAVEGGFGDFSSIGIAANGNPLVAYYDRIAQSLVLARCHEADCAGNEAMHTLDDPIDDVGRFTSLEVNAGGRADVAYVDSTTDDLKLAACQNPACDAVFTTTIDDGAGDSVGSYASLALDADGFPAIAYADITAGSLKFAKCIDASCAAPIGIHTIDSGDVGWYASLAIGTDGNPIISYYDIGNDALKVAKCVDPDCASPAVVTTLDDRNAGAGTYTSIAIRPNGLPIVSYRRGLAGSGGGFALTVAECRIEDCATGADLLTLDFRPGEITGADTSIAIGSDGGAVISYYDTTNQSLRVAKCNAQTCDGAGDDIFNDGFEEE